MTPIDDNWSDEQKAIYHQGQADALAKPKLTLADIRAMSTAEVAARMPEVREVLRRKDDPSDDDDE
jgi:hypothetical protein